MSAKFGLTFYFCFCTKRPILMKGKIMESETDRVVRMSNRGLGSNGTENRVKGSRQGPVDHVSAVLHLAQHSDIG